MTVVRIAVYPIDASKVEELRDSVDSSLIPLYRQQPGFQALSLTHCGDSVVSSSKLLGTVLAMSEDERETDYRTALDRAVAAQAAWEKIRGPIEPLRPGQPVPVASPELTAAEEEVGASWEAYTVARDAYYTQDR